MGAPHRPKINHGYGPGGKTVQLAISTPTILKEGVVGVENSAVNSKSVERAGERASVMFCFIFLFVCLFVCLF